jgi:Colicin V production protein
MTIWLLAIGLMAVFAGLGFFKGAIRTSISLAGVLLGVILSVPMSGAVLPLVKAMGAQNPVWLTLVPPVVAFLIVYFAFIGISFFAHHRVNLFYKYKRDDVDRIRWERVNRYAGVLVGLLTGAIYFILLCAVIYPAGYLTTQLSGEDNNPAMIKFINSARQGLADTGLDRAAAAIDPAPKMFYDAADVFGLIYHNPLLQSRLASYPYYLGLSQRTEFQELATDKEYNDLIFGKAPVTQIIDHPRTQGLLGNAEIMTFLTGTDIPDLKEYLRTGKSPKYDTETILGMWSIDKTSILTQIRKSKPDIRAKELQVIRGALDTIPPFSLGITPDHKVFVRVDGAAPAVAAATPPPEAAPNPAMDRYRQFMQPQQPAPKTNVVQAPPPIIPQIAGEGTWSSEGGQYVMTLSTADGKQVAANTIIRGDEMSLSVLGTPSIIFYKE